MKMRTSSVWLVWFGLQKSIKKALFSPNSKKVIKNSLSDISARRHVSLLNISIKVMAEVLAACLDLFILLLIHKVQTAFVKSMHTTDDMRNLLHICCALY